MARPAARPIAAGFRWIRADPTPPLELTGLRADVAMPAMSAHLAGCSACRDDHDSLLAFARTNTENDA